MRGLEDWGRSILDQVLGNCIRPLGMERERERESKTRDRSTKRRRRHRGVEDHSRSRRKDVERREPGRGGADTSEPRRPVIPPSPSSDPPSPPRVGGRSRPGSWAKPAARRAGTGRKKSSRASRSQEARSMSAGRDTGWLEKASGITAAGAWAARLELASR